MVRTGARNAVPHPSRAAGPTGFSSKTPSKRRRHPAVTGARIGGWLPGADHAVHSEAGTSIPALEAALTALRPGGVLSAVLYSGAVIGDAEKRAVLAWLEGLPLTGYTVLACRFANWADTAPLPCFVLKK